MAPHSSTLAWKIPWMEEPGRLQSMGLWRVRHDWAISLSLLCIGEGNGNPLQCSYLENPKDGVVQSRTQLKWLSSSSPINTFKIYKHRDTHITFHFSLVTFVLPTLPPPWLQNRMCKPWVSLSSPRRNGRGLLCSLNPCLLQAGGSWWSLPAGSLSMPHCRASVFCFPQPRSLL